MSKGAITMSQKEVDRLQVIQRTAEQRGRQAAAARPLGVSVRHVKRLVRRYRQEGAQGLVSHRRGRPVTPGDRAGATGAPAHLSPSALCRFWADLGL